MREAYDRELNAQVVSDSLDLFDLINALPDEVE